MSTYTVTSNADTNTLGTLRYGIENTTDPNIVFDPTITTIILSKQLNVARSVTITGNGMNTTVISGNSLYRVFFINGIITVNILDLTITNGFNSTQLGAGIYAVGDIDNNINVILNISNIIVSNNTTINFAGGGIQCRFCTFTMNNTTLINNSALVGGGLSSAFSTLSITNSTISSNTTTLFGGGINYLTSSTSTIINCTISGNTAGYGAGIYIDTPSITIINCTISNNTATSDNNGCGIHINNIYTPTIGNTIIANNTTSANPDVFGAVISLGYNLIGNTSSSFGFNAIGDQTNVNPMLGPLANNGGDTETMALLPDSPAINTGNNAIYNTYSIYQYDQRGPPYTRFKNNIDIGAYEYQFNICYSGKSKVLIKDNLTHKIMEINAEDVKSNLHQVYDTINCCFVIVKLNIVTNNVNRFMLIKKNSLGKNQPNNDFLITTAHKVIINGKKIKAKNVPNAIKIKVKPQKVYSICTEIECPIIVNGLQVMSWGYEKWMKYHKINKISWIDNHKKVFNQVNL